MESKRYLIALLLPILCANSSVFCAQLTTNNLFPTTPYTMQPSTITLQPDYHQPTYSIGTRVGCGLGGVALAWVGTLSGLYTGFTSLWLLASTQRPDSPENRLNPPWKVGLVVATSAFISATSWYGSVKLLEICWA